LLLDQLGKGGFGEAGFLQMVERAMWSSTARALGKFDGGLELLDCQSSLYSSFEAVSASPEPFTSESPGVSHFDLVDFRGKPALQLHLSAPTATTTLIAKKWRAGDGKRH
jgi:hypothetical protein